MKKLLKKILGKRLLFKLVYSRKIYNKLYKKDNKTSVTGLIKSFYSTRVYKGKNTGKSLEKLFNKVNLEEPKKEENFYYSLDILKTIHKTNTTIANLSIDYEKILDNSLLDFRKKLQKNRKNEDFYNNELSTLDALEILINRTIEKLEKNNINHDIIDNIKNIKNSKTQNFYEALQRILFFNEVLWQTNHILNGLGRLDKILVKYYEKDMHVNNLTKERAQELIKDFLLTLHKYYSFKSNVLMGDTGQIIELGGKDIDGQYIYNDLTYMFIDAIKDLKIPDPKILLRVSSDVPRSLMEKSLECIQTGIGCPLFANDDVIIPKLMEFGYKEDAYNYGTSACWEPFIIGKSLDQNNISEIIYIKPFENLLENENLNKIKSKEQLMNRYIKYVEDYLDALIEKTNNVKWENDPILSLVTESCIERNLDISEGGAVYNNYGYTGVGLSNLVNSIINIDRLVFKDKEYTFEQLNEIRKNNFDNNEELVKRLKKQSIRYGTDNEEVINLTNDIIRNFSKVIEKYKTPLGGKYKFGLSSPNYISSGKKSLSSFDGRKKQEPFGVHISSDISNAYTELIQFASQLDYNQNRFNGNVVDFFVSPNFIADNFEKFVDFLILSIKIGFFEMQMNVVSSKTLIEARKNPEKFPNLIVRVWGFSSYFKDLPDNYKDYLIERALKSEGSN